MSKHYQNETYSKGSSKFVQVSPVDGTLVEFRSKIASFSLEGIPTQALNFSVKLVTPQVVNPCDDPCGTVKQLGSLELRGNVQPGTDMAAFKAELDRLYAKAVNDYFLHSGLVPNVNANLSEE